MDCVVKIEIKIVLVVEMIEKRGVLLLLFVLLLFILLLCILEEIQW